MQLCARAHDQGMRKHLPNLKCWLISLSLMILSFIGLIPPKRQHMSVAYSIISLRFNQSVILSSR